MIRQSMKNQSKIADIFLETSQEKLDQPTLISKIKPKSKALIATKKLTKSFGNSKRKVLAVNNVSFNVYDNQNVALLGANGAGKTTLVEMIVGITKPSNGSISYNYEYANSFQEKIGIQFQDSTYPIGLKVKDVVNFMIDVYEVKISKQELSKMVEMFGLKSFWKKFARSLSGGQQQRLNILLALLHKPKVVILDELSTGLDISVKEQIINFVKQYCVVNKINILLISHDIVEIELLCQRIVIMQKGIIKVDLSMTEVIKKFKNLKKLLSLYI